jgi:hypothetical protein
MSVKKPKKPAKKSTKAPKRKSAKNGAYKDDDLDKRTPEYVSLVSSIDRVSPIPEPIEVHPEPMVLANPIEEVSMPGPTPSLRERVSNQVGALWKRLIALFNG